MGHDHIAVYKPVPPIPARLLQRPKSYLQRAYDLVGVPLRFVFPDHWMEKIGLSSLRAERFAMVLADMQGRCIDIGAYDNALLKIYMRQSETSAAQESIGVDTHDWGTGCTVIESSAKLPFPDNSFDTMTILAALNHIVERKELLEEARRVLKPDGQIVLTMISRFVGNISHRVRFWGEHSHRHVDEEESFGLNQAEVISILKQTGFESVTVKPFLYGLNAVYVGRHPQAAPAADAPDLHQAA